MFTAEPFDPFVNFSVGLFHLFQKMKNQKKKKKKKKKKNLTGKLIYDFNFVSVKLSYYFNCVLTPTSYARPNY